MYFHKMRTYIRYLVYIYNDDRGMNVLLPFVQSNPFQPDVHVHRNEPTLLVHAPLF